jgi:hypothetical protein
LLVGVVVAAFMAAVGLVGFCLPLGTLLLLGRQLRLLLVLVVVALQMAETRY